MAVEIERKFCVVGNEWRQTQGVLYRQGYLCRDKERTVRVRVVGNVAFLTIKGITQGATRAEFEYEIPVNDAELLLTICDGPLVEKIRHVITLSETIWEVDEFLAENAGLA